IRSQDGPRDTLEELLSQVLGAKDAATADLNDHGILLRSEKVRHVRRNHDEAASRIRRQLRLVERVSNSQVPRTVDDGDDFVMWMRMREDASGERPRSSSRRVRSYPVARTLLEDARGIPFDNVARRKAARRGLPTCSQPLL